MAYYSPCGGGYGSPLERDPQKVLDDVLDGFCTPADARDVYGVVLDLDAETVDMAATEARRASLEQRA
jgi:N-methylhydantoinase B